VRASQNLLLERSLKCWQGASVISVQSQRGGLKQQFLVQKLSARHDVKCREGNSGGWLAQNIAPRGSSEH